MDDVVELVREGYASLGYYGAAIAVVVIAIRWLRHPAVQELLSYVSSALLWTAWPEWIRKAFVFAAAFGASLLAALAAGQQWLLAIAAAVPVAIAAVAAHKATKAVGHAMTRAAVHGKPWYKPGVVRTVVDLVGVLPLDHRLLGLQPRARRL